ncbi:GNAT family N-acetyltransferase/peptidase C39 family protein [Parahaliea mediterranea]|uniref:GNAT family N-acetyltransferase/peptidase C39 family protein n=1 Tax=Parahaliea mediterranea TaxID=651086 RepID=A0A939DI53_9GAMM|nr:GNAT family N-acetyltransferase/peptidase C39 family protein [Parahaliea mediterranea]MBN7798683.1 GNAT family N-acetyltransferase/peptidase C39 family protein [Parahaliea mediterranea]
MDIRPALESDLPELLALESQSFHSDRISRRSFRRWLRHHDRVFLLAVDQGQALGYALVTLRRGTRLARLYSLAVAPQSRGRGVAGALLKAVEQGARDAGALYLRLEVASDNQPAINLYRKLGYQQFGCYEDYYEDHGSALRMEKCIRPYAPGGDSRTLPWLAQTTAFTCGPAALMMAMAGLPGGYRPSPEDEIQLWREATTVFMTSGHGGCHPLGLALAAHRRGFASEAWINIEGPLFLEGVRDENKKRVMRIAHRQFVEQCAAARIPVRHADIDQGQLTERFQAGANILILISTYRLDNMKAPHWVVLSGFDESCLYVHDPDLGDTHPRQAADAQRSALDCQHLPIARDSFNAMSRFGSSRLRAVVIVEAGPGTAPTPAPAT